MVHFDPQRHKKNVVGVCSTREGTNKSLHNYVTVTKLKVPGPDGVWPANSVGRLSVRVRAKLQCVKCAVLLTVHTSATSSGGTSWKAINSQSLQFSPEVDEAEYWWQVSYRVRGNTQPLRCELVSLHFRAAYCCRYYPAVATKWTINIQSPRRQCYELRHKLNVSASLDSRYFIFVLPSRQAARCLRCFRSVVT